MKQDRPSRHPLLKQSLIVLMVGDNRTADTGAAALGCPVHLVDHVSVSAKPDAPARVLDLIWPDRWRAS
jgi:hypothetical protein